MSGVVWRRACGEEGDTEKGEGGAEAEAGEVNKCGKDEVRGAAHIGRAKGK